MWDIARGKVAMVFADGTTETLAVTVAAKDTGGGDAVTVRKLMGYVEERLPDITKRYRREEQFPVVDSRGMDFPLATVKP